MIVVIPDTEGVVDYEWLKEGNVEPGQDVFAVVTE